MLDINRQAVISFLSGSQSSGYAPQSGEVLGILKQLNDNMKGSLADTIATEEHAIKLHNELMAAKEKEVETLTASIEEKLQRSGDLAVKITELKDDLKGTGEGLKEDKQFLADLDKTCKQKQQEWDERVKTRNQELAALADTIKILNDDGALEIFKKTLPSFVASFVQLNTRASTVRARALTLVRVAQRTAGHGHPELDFIALALHGKAAGFDKVLKMIDDMTANLKGEQTDDDAKKTHCAAEFRKTEDKKTGLQNTISSEGAKITKAKESIAALTEEIAALSKGIKALDNSVAEATEQRKEEHAEFTELMASDGAAKEILNFAKNRLYKFYEPTMYKASSKDELSEQDRIAANLAFEQGSSHAQLEDAPPPPPETVGAYTKKSGESAGVIAMIDLLIKELDKEMTEAKTDEDLAQKDYKELMSDSATKRAQDSKAVGQKEKAKAEMETALEEHSEANHAARKELMATDEYLSGLHGDCDWLIQNFDVRKKARVGEIDALSKAKDVLRGADYE
eukprot:NODE_6520_length_1665_cov_4.431730.p1 GENE.NODE_6520_length_1665_cov_4.431730~~NODE_6520_length_1665_cov_4.431730.p1  ORF type:complete len:513 (+),score=136.92 NODE_6520_length_1665_cov_4.431730:59-1597(+)